MLKNSIQTVQFVGDIDIYVQNTNSFKNKINLEIDRIAKNLEVLKLNLFIQKTILEEFSKTGFCDTRLYIRVKKENF